MFEIVCLVLMLCVIPMCKYSVKYGDGIACKEHLFYLTGIAVAMKVFLFGGVYATSLPSMFLMGITLFSLLSMLWATNTEQGWQDIPKWISLCVLFTLASSIPIKTVMLLAFVPLLPYLVYGFIQNVWPGRDPFDELIDKDGKKYFLGFIGNPNHTAAYLAPFVFICLWLGTNVSPWFYLAAAFTVYGLYRTRCFTACIAVSVGMCFIRPPWSFMGLAVVGLAAVALFWIREFRLDMYVRLMVPERDRHNFQLSGQIKKEQSFLARIYYLITALALWRKRPLMGHGPRGYMKEVYEAQAGLKGKYSNLVTYMGEYHGFARRTHNDLAESLVEYGITGFVLLAGFMASVLYGAVSSGNWIILAGLVCLIVNGFFFYTLSSFSCVPWIVMAACASGSGMAPISLPFVAGLLLSLFLAKLALTYVIHPHLASVWVMRANRSKDWQVINASCDKAVELCPTDGMAITSSINAKVLIDPFLAMHLAERAVHHFDGTVKGWQVWGRYGELMSKTGNWEGAKRALKYALFLNPLFKEAQMVLDVMANHEKDHAAKEAEKQQRKEQFARLARGGK